MRTEKTVGIAAPPARVWATTIEIDRWPSWNPTVETIELLDEGAVRVGTRARLRQPGSRPAVWTVTRFESPITYAWETRAIGMVVTARHDLESTATGTRVVLSIEVAGPMRPLLG